MESILGLVSLLFLGVSVEGAMTMEKPAASPPATFNFDVFPECSGKSAVADPIVPKLATQFTVKIEGKSTTEKGVFTIFDSEGFYEAEQQRGATVVYQKGVKSTFLYDFDSGKAYDIEQGTFLSLEVISRPFFLTFIAVFL